MGANSLKKKLFLPSLRSRKGSGREGGREGGGRDCSAACLKVQLFTSMKIYLYSLPIHVYYIRRYDEGFVYLQ